MADVDYLMVDVGDIKRTTRVLESLLARVGGICESPEDYAEKTQVLSYLLKQVKG